MKNLQFCFNLADISTTWPTHKYLILPKVQEDRTKIVDFLLMKTFCECLIFFGTVFKNHQYSEIEIGYGKNKRTIICIDFTGKILKNERLIQIFETPSKTTPENATYQSCFRNFLQFTRKKLSSYLSVHIFTHLTHPSVPLQYK